MNKNNLEKLKKELLDFKKSPLYKFRMKNNFLPVLGEGSSVAKIMFIGEAPGKKEAETGKPFCGASGKMLDSLLESAGLKREDIYITNIVNDRPPENRDPSKKEIQMYSYFLEEQIKIIQPKIIVTLGRFSMDYIMEKFGLEDKLELIGKAHGKVFETDFDYGKVKIIPFYHPAVALYNGGMKKTLLKDFKKVFNKVSSL
ncbi:uracil-DNA glycosylase [Patescibacteria group bacterium]|nr:uracil-DNA glycosylase [Patescibacteria group bacterium]MCG2694668.1 uracil-DNA glycosylase [Candidatus Parcubacteria bacterium]